MIFMDEIALICFSFFPLHQAEAMGNTVAVKAARKVVKPTQSKFTNSIEIKPGGKYELNAGVTHNIGNDVDVQIDAEAKLPQEPKTMK